MATVFQIARNARAFLLRSIAVFGGVFCAIPMSVVSAEPQDLTFGRLRDILVNERPISVAATLQSIGKQFPQYLAHHTLAYHSISLQGSTYENPRAIVFGTKGDFVISFNGDPRQRGYGALEVMEFSITYGYSFREIAFLQEPKNGAELIEPDEVELRTTSFLISKPNPSTCTSCHDQFYPRPIWEPFAIWPGFYGSVNDRLFRFLIDFEGRLNQNEMPSVPGLRGADKEKIGFSAYLDNRHQHPRYKNLPLPQGLDFSDFAGSLISDSKARPNLTLTKLLSIQTAKLIARDVSSRPDGINSLTLLAAVECARDSPNEFVTAALQRFVARNAIWRERFKRDIAGMVRRDLNRMQEYFGDNIRMNIDELVVDAKPELQPYLLASALDQLGMNINNYSLNNNRVSSFQDGANGLFAIGPTLLETLQKQLQLDHIPACAEIYELLLRHSWNVN